MSKPKFKLGDRVESIEDISDTTVYIVEGIVKTTYGIFYHLQSSTNLAILLTNVEESKLLID